MVNKITFTNDPPASPEPLTPRVTELERNMTFPEAMVEVINGKRITRVSWKPASDYCFLKDSWLTIFTNGEFYAWKVNDGDMMANDWIVLNTAN